MKQTEIAHLLHAAATKGVEKALQVCPGRKSLLTCSAAYRLYGRSIVDRWVAEELILPVRGPGETSKYFFERTALEQVAAANNRITYLPVAER